MFTINQFLAEKLNFFSPLNNKEIANGPKYRCRFLTECTRITVVYVYIRHVHLVYIDILIFIFRCLHSLPRYLLIDASHSLLIFIAVSLTVHILFHLYEISYINVFCQKLL